MKRLIFCFSLAVITIAICRQPMPVSADDSEYLIGSGIADVTGPISEVNFMGYARTTQVGKGLHTRLYARAFIIGQENGKRIVYVSIDTCMGTQLVRIRVIEKLKTLYGDLYGDNVAISGIHTHSGPAGFFQYVLFEITSFGFVKQSLDVVVNGIVSAIQDAHENLVSGKLYINSGQLLNANINRSPSAYLNNPPEERAKYQGDTDKEMVLVKMVDSNGKDFGLINWFAVHCTSMNYTNRLVSSDNKGHASVLFERMMNGPSVHVGKGKFVAAFAQTNSGDVSPNINGTFCMDTGLPCEFYHSTCNNRTEMCAGVGPGRDMWESTRLIGERQFNMAKDLYASASTPLSGPVDFIHQFLDITNITVEYKNATGRTCGPAMGFAFAAGTTDGAGDFNFVQGDTTGNKFWDFVRNFLAKPTPEQIACHHPKPILLDTADLNVPYAWQASIVDLQILRVGQLVIVAIPSEFSTMSGRRMREAIKQALIEEKLFGDEGVVVISGLSNTYSDYVTTPEEYDIQRYEGASTAYGRYTLPAYIQEFTRLARAMARNETVAPGPNPPNLQDSQQLSLLPNPIEDAVPIGKKFGDVVTEPLSTYKRGSTVSAKFWAGCPRNNLMTESTYLTVEQLLPSGLWNVVATDAYWETRFEWERTFFESPFSHATVFWDIPLDSNPGTYRIQHFGYHINALEGGSVSPYVGVTRNFTVTL